MIPDTCRTNYLFLLMGKNPLPNYVAAQLLVRDGGMVYLLHTGGLKGTSEAACRLKGKIEAARTSVTVVLREVDEADGQKIEKKLGNEILPGVKEAGGTVGLNYTGGTKPMAVHSYRVLKKEFPQGCFSYLNANSLRMFIHQGDAPTQKLTVGRAVELSLEDVIALHGYKLTVSVRREPQYPDLYLPLAKVVANRDGFHEWAGRWDSRKQSKGWLQQKTLETLPALNEYPHLSPIVAAFQALGGTPEAVAAYLGFGKLESHRKWFKGTWLEEYCLDALAKVAKNLDLRSYGINLQLEPLSTVSGGVPKGFQLDVAAMIGYQLFAISCIVSQEEGGETKKHLFEAYVRARQLGGDEARVALVSCVENPKVIQDEVEKAWDAEGRIRVFGRRHIQNLATYLQNWFETANKEA